MKKTYTLFLASCVIFSASAFDKADAIQIAGRKVQNAKAIHEAAANPQKLEGNYEVQGKKLLGARKADANASIEGLWDFILGDYYMDYGTRTNLTVTFNAVVEGGNNVIFVDETNGYLPIVGGYSQNTGLLWFGNELLGQEGNISIYQQAFVWDGNETVNQQITGHYNAEDGTITFGEDTGIAFVVSQKIGAQEQTDVLDMFDLNGAFRADHWKPLGTGEFLDNIFYPFMTGVENSTPASVQILTSEEYPGLLKVMNPFQTVYKALKIDGMSPTMYINAADAENVLLSEQTVGLNVNVGTQLQPQITGTLLYFSDSWYYEETEIFWNESGIQYIKKSEEDGVVTINFPSYSCVIFGPYMQTAFQCPFPSYLKFYEAGGDYNAVGEIINDNDEPVEYYNIQGIRVLNPEAGQLLIKRQGLKSQKVIF